MTEAAQLYLIVRGRDSILDLPLLEDGELAPSTGVTRCDLVFKREGVADITFSSSSVAEASWFILQYLQRIDGEEIAVVRVNLRTIPTPPADGRYKVDVYLWDAVYVNGRLWGTLDAEIRPAIPVAA